MAINKWMEAIQTTGTRLYVSEDGTNFLDMEVPYGNSIDVSGGERNSVPVPSFNESTTVAGADTPVSMSISLAAHVDLPVTNLLRRSQQTASELWFRIRTAPASIRFAQAAAAVRTVAITANTGAATFAGTGASDIDYATSFGLGTFIQHDPDGSPMVLNLTKKDDSTDTSFWSLYTTEKYPTTALAAKPFVMYRPQYGAQFRTSVLGFTWTGPSESVFSDTLTLAPALIPDLKALPLST